MKLNLVIVFRGKCVKLSFFTVEKFVHTEFLNYFAETSAKCGLVWKHAYGMETTVMIH